MRIMHLTTDEFKRELAMQTNLECSPAPEPDGDDAGAIGARVRSLASLAHRILPRQGDRSSAVSSDAIAQVIEQCGRLQRRLVRLQQLHNLRLEELLRWTGNLLHRLEEHL